jgi:hypothetical protein
VIRGRIRLHVRLPHPVFRFHARASIQLYSARPPSTTISAPVT